MSVIQVKIDARKAMATLSKGRASMTRTALDSEIKKTAKAMLALAKKETPRGFRKQTYKLWEIHKLGPSRYRIRNRSRVFRWLDKGTAAHTARKARKMFVPRNRRATLGKVGRGKVRGLKYGRDYVLSRKVRGIKPIRLTSRIQASATKAATSSARQYVRRVYK